MASLFFALLALTALTGAVVLIGLLLAERRGVLPDAAGVVLDEVRARSLPLAWVVATVATFGSLYYSEVAGFIPCKLCWYQRIAMYPLVVILGIAGLRGDRGVRPYAITLAAVGAVIATYHYSIQWLPALEVACAADNPCSAVWVREFGFISIPFMALAGFVAIIVLLATATRPAGEPGDAAQPEDELTTSERAVS